MLKTIDIFPGRQTLEIANEVGENVVTTRTAVDGASAVPGTRWEVITHVGTATVRDYDVSPMGYVLAVNYPVGDSTPSKATLYVCPKLLKCGPLMVRCHKFGGPVSLWNTVQA